MQDLAEPGTSRAAVDISDAPDVPPPSGGESRAERLQMIASSIAEAFLIVICAELGWFLVAYFVHNRSFDLGPLLVLMVYPLPIAVAALRKHNALLSIMVVNLWLGWTIVGWFVVLIWACNWNVEANQRNGVLAEH